MADQSRIPGIEVVLPALPVLPAKDAESLGDYYDLSVLADFDSLAHNRGHKNEQAIIREALKPGEIIIAPDPVIIDTTRSPETISDHIIASFWAASVDILDTIADGTDLEVLKTNAIHNPLHFGSTTALTNIDRIVKSNDQKWQPFQAKWSACITTMIDAVKPIRQEIEHHGGVAPQTLSNILNDVWSGEKKTLTERSTAVFTKLANGTRDIVGWAGNNKQTVIWGAVGALAMYTIYSLFSKSSQEANESNSFWNWATKILGFGAVGAGVAATAGKLLDNFVGSTAETILTSIPGVSDKVAAQIAEAIVEGKGITEIITDFELPETASLMLTRATAILTGNTTPTEVVIESSNQLISTLTESLGQSFDQAKGSVVSKIEEYGFGTPQWLQDLSAEELLEGARIRDITQLTALGTGSVVMIALLSRYISLKNIAIGTGIYFLFANQKTSQWIPDQITAITESLEQSKTKKLNKLANHKTYGFIAEFLDQAIDVSKIGDWTSDIAQYAHQNPITATAGVTAAWIFKGIIFSLAKSMFVTGGKFALWIANNPRKAGVVATSLWLYREEIVDTIAQTFFPKNNQLRTKLHELTGEASEGLAEERLQDLAKSFMEQPLQAITHIPEVVSAFARGEMILTLQESGYTLSVASIGLNVPIQLGKAAMNNIIEVFTKKHENPWKYVWIGGETIILGSFAVAGMRSMGEVARQSNSNAHAFWRVLKSQVPFTKEWKFVVRSTLSMPFQRMIREFHGVKLGTIEAKLLEAKHAIQAGNQRVPQILNNLKDIIDAEDFSRIRSQLTGTRYSIHIRELISDIKDIAIKLETHYESGDHKTALRVLDQSIENIGQHRKTIARISRSVGLLFTKTGNPNAIIQQQIKQSVIQEVTITTPQPQRPTTPLRRTPSHTGGMPAPPVANVGQAPSSQRVAPVFDGNAAVAIDPKINPQGRGLPAEIYDLATARAARGLLPAETQAQRNKIQSLLDDISSRIPPEQAAVLQAASEKALKAGHFVFLLLTLKELADADDPVKAVSRIAIYWGAFQTGARLTPGNHPLVKLIGGTGLTIMTAVFGQEQVEALAQNITDHYNTHIDLRGKQAESQHFWNWIQHNVALEALWDETTGEIWKGEDALAYFSDTKPATFNKNGEQAYWGLTTKRILYRDASDIRSWNKNIIEKVRAITMVSTAMGITDLKQDDLSEVETKEIAKLMSQLVYLKGEETFDQYGNEIIATENSPWIEAQVIHVLKLQQEIIGMPNGNARHQKIRAFLWNVQTYKNLGIYDAMWSEPAYAHLKANIDLFAREIEGQLESVVVTTPLEAQIQKYQQELTELEAKRDAIRANWQRFNNDQMTETEKAAWIAQVESGQANISTIRRSIQHLKNKITRLQHQLEQLTQQ